MAIDETNPTLAALERLGGLIPAMVSYLDRDLVFRYTSPVIAHRLGVSRAEIVGRHARDVFGPAGFEARRVDLERALAGDRVVREGPAISSDRIGVYSRSTYVPDADDEGRVRGVLAFVEDLSEAYLAEQRLRDVAAELERAQEAGQVGVWVSNGRERDQVTASAGVLRILGLSSFDGRSETLEALIHPDDRALNEAAGREARRTGRFASTHRIVRPSGEVRWVEVRADVAVEVDGGVRNYGTIHDVTERRLSEIAHEALEARHGRLFEIANEAVWALDDASRVTFANQRMVRLLGRDESELVGAPVLSFVPPDLQQAHVEHLERGRTGVAERFDTSLLRRDGSSVAVRISASPLFAADGTFEGSIAMVADLTEQRQLEEQLRQAQKMDAVGRLAGGIAHDFNNMLSVILSFNALAQADLPPAHPVAVHLSEVQRAAERAAELTKQLLAFSRKQLLKPRVLDPNALVREQGPMIRRLIGEDIELSFVLRAEGRVRADAGQLAQVLVNLVVNARDAMPEGGTLTIATRDVDVAATPADKLELKPGPYVEVSVSDTGMGMDEETVARAFEPFFTTKGQGRGTGLGLSTVFGILKQSGGAVAIDTDVGGGSTLSCFLPRTTEEVATPSPRPRAEPRPSETETILVVEDDDRLRALVVNVLGRRGYRVLEAPDPIVAIQVAGDHVGAIHLLLTDIVMPHMNGRALADRITASRPDTRVLFMSGYTEDSIVHRGVLDPGVTFLQKPITPDSLVPAVRRVLDARGARP